MSLPSADLEELRKETERLTDQLPRSSSKDEALEIAIKAAETSMQALKLAQDPVDKASLSTRVKQLLREAEQIKLSRDWRTIIRSGNLAGQSSNVDATSTSSPRAKPLKEPKSDRELPKAEQILILKSSFLHGFKFPPWTTPPEPNEFELNDGENMFLYVSLSNLSYFASH